MTLVYGLDGYEGCKVAANIIHGFECIGPDMVWKWQPDEFTVKYTQWDAWQPNNLILSTNNMVQSCAVVNTRNFRWNDLDCRGKSPFGCMIKNSKTMSLNCNDHVSTFMNVSFIFCIT